MSAAEIEASGWRLPDDACALLARLVAKHKPDLIVECGSGRSTVVLAEALAARGRGRVVALEDSLQYGAETDRLIREHDLEDWASVRYAPLEAHDKALLTDKWYARNAWYDLAGIGMLVVDGPPGGSSRYARHPALPLLRDRLLPGCVIVLDDVNRDPEKTIMRHWNMRRVTSVRHEKATLAYGTLA
jgi:hypothetical protein